MPPCRRLFSYSCTPPNVLFPTQHFPERSDLHISQTYACAPLGKMPGSINVAMQKLARVKRKTTMLQTGMEEETCSASQGHLRSERGTGRMVKTLQSHSLHRPHTETSKDLREAQEKRRGPDEEGCRCGHWHIATGTESPGRGGVSKSPTHTDTRRHWGENTKIS